MLSIKYDLGRNDWKMKIIEFNKENVKEEEIEMRVEKSRGIILNSQGKALIVKHAGLYMLPGGRVEQETPREALKREIMEEAGIFNIECKNEPFLKIRSYDRDYYTRKLGRSITRLTETYFYFGETSEDIDLHRQRLTQSEKETEFLVEFENLSTIRYLAETNKTENRKIVYFNRELFTALDQFASLRRNEKEELERA